MRRLYPAQTRKFSEAAASSMGALNERTALLQVLCCPSDVSRSDDKEKQSSQDTDTNPRHLQPPAEIARASWKRVYT